MRVTKLISQKPVLERQSLGKTTQIYYLPYVLRAIGDVDVIQDNRVQFFVDCQEEFMKDVIQRSFEESVFGDFQKSIHERNRLTCKNFIKFYSPYDSDVFNENEKNKVSTTFNSMVNTYVKPYFASNVTRVFENPIEYRPDDFSYRFTFLTVQVLKIDFMENAENYLKIKNPHLHNILSKKNAVKVHNEFTLNLRPK